MSTVALDRLSQTWAACARCRLHRDRTRVVVGSGAPTASLLIIAEAPSRQDDQTGQPFSGAEGGVLVRLMRQAQLDVADCFITYLVGCLPPEGRPPCYDEVEACLPRVNEVAAVVRPKAVLILGGTALTALTGEQGITRWRGRWLTIATPVELIRVPALATYHPATLVPGRLRDPQELSVAQADLESMHRYLVDRGNYNWR